MVRDLNEDFDDYEKRLAQRDARIHDLELAAKENARYSTEMREEFERRGERIAALENAMVIADVEFGYPQRGSAVDDTCQCSYCQYARVRDSLMESTTK